MRSPMLYGLLAVAVAALAAMPAPAAWEGPKGPPPGPPSGPRRTEGPPPKPIVLQFRHVPAESFLDTLKQLARNEQVAEALRQMPIALNEAANAVVILAPPEAGEFLMAIAKGLDQPNEFALQAQQREREQMQFQMQMEAARQHMAQAGQPPMGGPRAAPPPGAPRQGPGGPPPSPPGPQGGRPLSGPMQRPGPGPMGGMCPMCPMRRGGQPGQPMPGAPAGPRPGAPMPGASPGATPWQGMPGAPVGPRAGVSVPRSEARPPAAPQRSSAAPGPRAEGGGEGLGRLGWLVSPEARERLDLAQDQVEKIRRLLAEAESRVGPAMERMQEALKNVPPEQRARQMQEMLERLAAERARRVQELREQVRQILTPRQRERLEQWMMEQPPAAPQPPRAEPPRRGEQGPPPGAPARPAAPVPPPSFAPSRARPGAGVMPPGSAAPAVQTAPARFWFTQQETEEGGPPSVKSEKGDKGGSRLPPGLAGLDLKGFDLATMAGAMQMMRNPDLQAQIGLTAEQRFKLEDLEERGRAMGQRIRDELQAKFGPPDVGADLPPEEREARRREIMAAVQAEMQAAKAEFQALINEASNILTPEQRAQLKDMGRQQAQSEVATGGLMFLTTPQAREQFAFSYDQVERIKMIVRDLEAEARRLSDETFGPGKQPTIEELRSEKYAPLREQHAEMVKKAFDRILTLAMGEQRPKLEKWWATRPKPGSRPVMKKPGAPPADSGKDGQGGEPKPAWKPRSPESESPTKGYNNGVQAPPSGPVATLALAERPARFFLADDTAVEPAQARREPAAEGERPRRPDGPPAAQLLRLLEEPEVRTKLGLTNEQEQKINALQEKARQINLEIREQVHEKLKAEARPDMTLEEREALRRRAAQAMEEAMRGARDRLDPLINEGEKILTEEQRTKLKDLARDRVKADMATGGLAALLMPKVQQELGLSAEQVEKIKAVVQDLHAQAEKLRDEVLGPGKEPAPEDLRGEKGETLRRRHGEMVKDAREKVMDLLTPEQREKVEQAEKRMAERRGTLRPGGRPEAPPPTRGYNSPI